jgi:hypothetical protein
MGIGSSSEEGKAIGGSSTSGQGNQ